MMASIKDIRKSFRTRLSNTTKYGYLLVASTKLLLNHSASDIHNNLELWVKGMSSDGYDMSGAKIRIKNIQIAELRESLPQFLFGLLLVELESLIHDTLNLAAGRKSTDDAVSFETLLSKLWPRASRGIHAWAYADLIYLSEIRNSIVHANNKISVPNNRLTDAGWREEDAKRLSAKTQYGFGDFLRFKRVVRTVVNEVFKGLESRH